MTPSATNTWISRCRRWSRRISTSWRCSPRRRAAGRRSASAVARIWPAPRSSPRTTCSASKPPNNLDDRRPFKGRPGYDRAMDDEIPNRVYGDPLARWFVTEAYRIADTGQLIRAAGEQLVAAGIPLFRLAYFQLTLHPEFAGKSYVWQRGRGVEVSEAAHGLLQGSGYLDSPLPAVFEQRRTIRVRLEGTEPQAPILKQLKGEGATDYVALPLLFTTGHVDALSVVSDRPGGFSTVDLERMFQLQFAFTRIVETHSLRDTAVNLL